MEGPLKSQSDVCVCLCVHLYVCMPVRVCLVYTGMRLTIG